MITMWFRPLARRLAATREALSMTSSYEGALRALSAADNATVRRIERDMFPGGAPFSILVVRERLAEAYIARLRAQHTGASTASVTPDMVASWLIDSLDACMPGGVGFDGPVAGRYRVTMSPAAAPRMAAVATVAASGDGGVRREFSVEVTTAEGHDPRRFRVSLDVAPGGPSRQAPALGLTPLGGAA